MLLTIVALFGAYLAAASGENISSDMLKKIFDELDGPAKEIVEVCLKQNSLKTTDFKDYKEGEKVSEPELCFMKCFYEGLMILDDEGKMNIDLLKKSPEYSNLSDGEWGELEECFTTKIGNIKTCDDMMKLEQCVELMY